MIDDLTLLFKEISFEYNERVDEELLINSWTVDSEKEINQTATSGVNSIDIRMRFDSYINYKNLFTECFKRKILALGYPITYTYFDVSSLELTITLLEQHFYCCSN